MCVLNGIFDGCEGDSGSLEHIIPNAISLLLFVFSLG